MFSELAELIAKKQQIERLKDLADGFHDGVIHRARAMEYLAAEAEKARLRGELEAAIEYQIGFLEVRNEIRSIFKRKSDEEIAKEIVQSEGALIAAGYPRIKRSRPGGPFLMNGKAEPLVGLVEPVKPQP